MEPDRTQSGGARPRRRGRVIRDSFTMPPSDHQLIRELQLVYARAGVLFNKGEVLRAGLHALKGMTQEQLTAIAERIEHLKTGRAK